jgi:hypothetical protein
MAVLNQSLGTDEIVIEKSKKSQGLQKHSPVPMLSNDGLEYLIDFLALQTVLPEEIAESYRAERRHDPEPRVMVCCQGQVQNPWRSLAEGLDWRLPDCGFWN